MARKIAGSTIIITGASAGIGKSLAVELSALGARLILSARRTDKLEALNAQLGSRHLVVPVDVSRQEDCERLIATAAEQFGRIDTLVCNAGYGALKPLASTTRQEMLDIFATNVFGTTDCIHAAVPIMRKQDRAQGYRGQIMIVSSAAARRGLPMFGPYSATKAAQLSLAEALRVELKEERIAVTSVHPVGTETDFFTTAESKGVGKLPPRMKGDVTQTPEQVAQAMVRAIEHPRPEVWPFRPARWVLTFATFAPRIADRIMLRARGKMV
jgi:short-subunit dehydrogenase